jgi:pimeloyl-ACP methyl ester carboxylesterase
MRPVNHRFEVLLVLALLAPRSVAQSNLASPMIQAVEIGNGITLHYVDLGKGVPVIFVHGSLSDGSYWADQVREFARHYRAIAYSRRYNYPNSNSARRGYSAAVDAQDLATFIRTLNLGKVVVIGHSYGALAALFLAAKHPELVRLLFWRNPPPFRSWPISRAIKRRPARQCLWTFNGGWSCPCGKRLRGAIVKVGSEFSWITSSTIPMRGTRCRSRLAMRRCAMSMNGI